MADTPEKSIFLAALERESPAEREEFLLAACGGDGELRRAVDQLLAAHQRTDNLLDRVPSRVARVRASWESPTPPGPRPGGGHAPGPDHLSTAEWPGTVIGPYTLRELIGEGGFGQVFVAEQREPVRRKVALKVIKPGMDSREVIARFEAERQALALMDHPHIARVFDAGTTSSGRPYFVMELVRGIAITQFCDENRMAKAQRLALFIDVCHAVQHAHQKGVIHRDLKPGNVLVTLHDGKPVAKVIDFGVAKAIGEPLTARTIYTGFTQVVGTPLYMSPEQVALSGLDVDTRSDIYSLGVLLYELLTGTTPFDLRRLQTASFDELRRILREEDPPRPSTRLTTLGRPATTDTAERNSLPPLAPLAVRGDLDWIVMKALEKDRTRRYETAAELAADVQRHLDQEPVAARPPSPLYRFGKFARRQKAFLTTASLVCAALVLGTAVSVWQAVRATRARTEADALRQEAVDFAGHLQQANVLLDTARANADSGRWAIAYQQHTKATELQPDHYPVWSGRASLFVRLGLWNRAAADYARALNLGAPANSPGWWGVPQLCLYVGDRRSFRAAATQMLEHFRNSPDVLSKIVALRGCLVDPRAEIDPQTLVQLAEPLAAGSFESRFGPFAPGAFIAPQLGPQRRAPRNQDFAKPPPGPPPGGEPGGPPRSAVPREIARFVAGLAHYRAGNLPRAIMLLQGSLPPGSPRPMTAATYPVLAMAYHQAGRDQEALAMLANAKQSFDQYVTLLQESELGTLPVPWFDFVEYQLLYREATARVTGQPPADDPRLSELERRGLDAIQVD